MPKSPQTWNDSNNIAVTILFWYQLLAASFCISLFKLLSVKPSCFCCFRKGAAFLRNRTFLSCHFISTWLSLFADWRKRLLLLCLCCSVSVYCTYTFCLSCLALCDSTPSEFLELSFPRYPAAAPLPVPAHAFFLFLVLVKSGMACVFHHRNRHNRPTQPSSGSANRDQIKSIIQSVCAKAFFLFPSLSLRHSRLILEQFQKDKEGGGAWTKFWT